MKHGWSSDVAETELSGVPVLLSTCFHDSMDYAKSMVDSNQWLRSDLSLKCCGSKPAYSILLNFFLGQHDLNPLPHSTYCRRLIGMVPMKVAYHIALCIPQAPLALFTVVHHSTPYTSICGS